jgi:hypothetical protein
VLRSWKAAVYLACDRPQTMRSLGELPEVQDAAIDELELRAFLHRCVHHELIVTNDRSWLGLAVHNPARREPAAREPETVQVSA